MFLLDTNVISELRKVGAGRADANVTRWQAGTESEALYISVITLMELEYGRLLLARKDRSQAALLRDWLHLFVMPGFEHRTLPVDCAVALRCAQLHVPNRRSERDALIAATAIIHGMKIVTRNTADFAGLDVAVINPWAGEPVDHQ